MCARESAHPNRALLKELVEQRLEEEEARSREEEEARVAAREQTCDSLFEVMESILRCEEIYLEDEAAKSFHITIKDLDLDAEGDEGCYFRPLSSARLESFPFDLSDEPTKHLLHSFASRKEGPLRSNAESLLGELWCLAGECQRICPDGHTKTNLMKAANWDKRRFCLDILREDLFSALRSAGKSGRVFGVSQGYVTSGQDRENQPHIIVMIQHSYLGDDKISRAEVLTICAVIMTQLEHEYLNSHYITPVMIISLMDSLQGRILQAYVTNSGLMIKKSKLYDFGTQADFEQSMNLFSRYMASDRIGDTRRFVSFDINNQVPN